MLDDYLTAFPVLPGSTFNTSNLIFPVLHYGIFHSTSSPDSTLVGPKLQSLQLASTNATFALFLAQTMLIIALCTLLGYAFQFVGQPKVVGELLAGVCLGPTVLGNIPRFTDTIMSSASSGMLTLTSNIGLIIFMLLVGLETDVDLIVRYARQVALIALPGMAIPFGIAAGVSKLIYDVEGGTSATFTTFMLFLATTMAVTSLSVLSRVVAELKLLSTTLGSVVIAAALAVFLWFVVRPFTFFWIRHSHFSLDGPTSGPENKVPNGLLTFVIVGSLISSFVTQIAGLHPILGALIFGIAIPHQALAVRVTESVEAIANGVLLPLYFATSAGQVNFKLLNDGKTWGLTLLMVVATFASKFLTTSAFTRVAGFSWRESMFVASLAQSKGIIELVILTVGLQIGVISPRVYAMIFFACLATTVTVRPLSLYIYGDPRSRAGGTDAKETLGDASDLGKPRASEKVQKTDDTKKRKSSSDDAEQDFVISAALTSTSPSLDGLLGLASTLGQCVESASQAHSRSGKVALDLIRLLPLEYTTASILRTLTAGTAVQNGGRTDAFLASVRCCTALQGVPSSDTLLRMRTLASAKLKLANTFNGGRGDVYTVPEEDMLSTLVEANGHAQQSLATSRGSNIGPGPSGGELGHGLVLLPEVKQSSGILIGPHVMECLPRAGRTPLSRAWISAEAQGALAVLEHDQTRKRVVVAFWGGRDDRAAVELARKMAASTVLDVVVVAGLSSVTSKQADWDFSEEEAERTQHQTVNLKTVAQPDAARKDIRFLFEQGVGEMEAQGDTAEPSKAAAPEITPEEEKEPFARAKAVGGSAHSGAARGDEIAPAFVRTQRMANGSTLTFILLEVDQQKQSAGSASGSGSASGTSIAAVLTYVQTCVVGRGGGGCGGGSSDLLIIGRGKVSQRPSSFRKDVDELVRQSFLRRAEEAAQQRRHETLARLGKVAGSAAQAALAFGIECNVLVLQAKKT
ncbi:Predicted K /H-antiporter [Ceraceosorus bombacis]|uniref:Predicted K /H-antiporter n=1 Tax=Ceraceosorus bombacis TaxID=401625 RepID=A0A0P1BU33_9BASI|nr:Predicted K /H-antiporter [Ceraceosorus bombacis]